MKKWMVLLLSVGIMVGCTPEGANEMNNEASEVVVNQEVTVGEYTEMVADTSEDLEKSIVEFNYVLADKQRHFEDDWYADLEASLSKMRISSYSVLEYDENIPSELQPVHDEYVSAVKEYKFVADNFMEYVYDGDIRGMRDAVEKMSKGEEHLHQAVVKLQDAKEKLGY